MDINPAEKVDELLEQLELRDVRRRRTIRQRLHGVPDRLLFSAIEDTFILCVLDGSEAAWPLLQLLLDEADERGRLERPGEA